MRNVLYQSANTGASLHHGQIARFILKGCSYAVYGLLVVVDGVNNPESFKSKFLTIPYFLGGLALARSFCEALDHGYEGHAFIFFTGLSTLGGLA